MFSPFYSYNEANQPGSSSTAVSDTLDRTPPPSSRPSFDSLRGHDSFEPINKSLSKATTTGFDRGRLEHPLARLSKPPRKAKGNLVSMSDQVSIKELGSPFQDHSETQKRWESSRANFRPSSSNSNSNTEYSGEPFHLLPSGDVETKPVHLVMPRSKGHSRVPKVKPAEIEQDHTPVQETDISRSSRPLRRVQTFDTKHSPKASPE